MSAGMSYLSALRSDVESPFDVAGSDDVVGLGASSRNKFATAMLWTRRERRRDEGPDAGVLEPEETSLDDDDAELSRVGRGRGSGGSETFPSTGTLMTIMVTIGSNCKLIAKVLSSPRVRSESSWSMSGESWTSLAACCQRFKRDVEGPPCD